MMGSIAGDIAGSVYEAQAIKTEDFPLFVPASRFTDDTVLSVAVARAILENIPYGEAIKDFAQRYPKACYGYDFSVWASSPESLPYNSWGNGSAMRVGPVGFAFDAMEDVLEEAKNSAKVTHDHPEGIKGAQATALAIFMARTGVDKRAIRDAMQIRFDYDMERTLDDIRPNYRFDVSCQGSVPESIIAFLESVSVEDAIRKAISLGGDSDTMASIAGGIAEAAYGEIPAAIDVEVRKRLPNEFLRVIDAFYDRYINRSMDG